MVKTHPLRSIVLRWSAAVILTFSSSLFYLVLASPTIGLSTLMVTLFHPSASLTGTLLTINAVTVEFIRACIAPSAYILLTLLLLLTPGISRLQFAKALVTGIVSLLILNVVRIWILIEVLLRSGVNYFNGVHLLFWLMVSSVAVAAVWIFLVHRFTIRQIPVYDDLVTMYTRLSGKK